MIHKPKLFLFVALGLALVAISFPLQVLYLYSHSFGELGGVLNKISVLNIICILVVAYSSYQAYVVSPQLKWLAPLSLGLIFWNNLVVGSYGTDFSMTSTSLATMGFSFLLVPLVSKKARYVLADEKRRWWARPKRYKKRISATLNPFVGTTVHAHTFDVSETGAFIHVEGEANDKVPRIGESIRISLNVGGMRNVRCEAVIIRVTEPLGEYPTGLGVRFKSIDRQTKSDLGRFLEQNHEGIAS